VTTVTRVPAVGDILELVVDDGVSRTQIVQFAGVSGDFSVLHTDEPAARAQGHPSIMAHGMLTMAVSGRVVTEWFGADALRTLDARFTAPVWPGDRLITTATVQAVDQVGALALVLLTLATHNQHGVVVLTGEASVAIDFNSNSE
jgi:acyl dehydratase